MTRSTERCSPTKIYKGYLIFKIDKSKTIHSDFRFSFLCKNFANCRITHRKVCERVNHRTVVRIVHLQ